jgi:ribosomal protein L44E
MIRAAHLSALRALLAVAISLCAPTQVPAVQRTGFDHLTTGFELQGAHRDLSCEYCHVHGVFKGTPRTCQGCHAPGSPVSATAKPVNHIASATDCSLCHAHYNFWPVVRVDHTAVNGSCFSCHNGVVAKGKTPDHIPSDNNCDACHTTIAFNPQRMDHGALAAKSACRGCHSGVRAAAAPRSHVMTTAECGTCHSTLSWSPARFDHSTVGGACQTCHNGATAIGKVANHLATTLDCSSCHRYPHWTPVLMAAQTPNASSNAAAAPDHTRAPPGRRRPVVER